VAYVRRKKIDGAWYFYLVRGIRVDGVVRQKVLLYLGKHATVEAAYEHWHRESKKPGKKTHATMMLRRLQQYLRK
jgi:hypothetical protein